MRTKYRLVTAGLIFAVLILALTSFPTLAQDIPEARWDKTFGGSDDDYSYEVQQTRDGGYIVAGMTESYGAGQKDVWLIKTDSSGNKKWDKTFGSVDYDEGWSVWQTRDGGYIVVSGTRLVDASDFDAWLIKTDSSGNKEWDKTFGGSGDDSGHSVQQTEDGGYIVAGLTHSFGAGFNSDAWLLKADADGSMTWNKTFGGSGDDWGESVQQTPDGGYIVAGGTRSFGAGQDDVWLIKTDSAGGMTWNKTFGGPEIDYGLSIQQTQDGGYIVAGWTMSYGAGQGDVWLIKADADGSMTWNKTFGGSNFDWSESVQQTQDGGYIVAGRTTSFGAGQGDVWLIKTDSAGGMTWNKTFGGSNDESGKSVQQTQDGGYIIAGGTNSYGAGNYDVWLIKVGGEIEEEEAEGLPLWIWIFIGVDVVLVISFILFLARRRMRQKV